MRTRRRSDRALPQLRRRGKRDCPHGGHAHTDVVVAQGFNYRLDELRAAIGLVQLERLEAANRARAGILASYRKALAAVDALVLPFREEPGIRSAHHLAVVVLPEGVSR